MDPAPALKLDPLTLMVTIAWTAMLMGVVSFALARATPQQRLGLQEWAKSMGYGSMAFTLYVLRAHTPHWLNFLVANAMVLAFPAYGLLALSRLFNAPVPRWVLGVPVGLGYAGVLATQVWGLPLQFAAFTLSAAMSAMMAGSVLLIWRHCRRRPSAPAWLTGSLLGVLALAFAVRAVVMLVGTRSATAPTANTLPQIGALVVGALFILGASLGFFFLVHERQRGEARELARRDGLTGLYNRAGFFELADPLVIGGGKARFSVVMLDIDHFKAINDTYGHAGGDLTLNHAARRVANAVRLNDLPCRWGGEEFCLLLPDCGEADAARLAERLVADAALQKVRLRDGRCTGYTVSVGYAYCTDAHGHPEPLERVIERADLALYSAKRAGRNQAKAAPPVRLAAPVAAMA